MVSWLAVLPFVSCFRGLVLAPHGEPCFTELLRAPGRTGRGRLPARRRLYQGLQEEQRSARRRRQNPRKQALRMKRTITVTGNGTAQAPPDMVTVSLGLECRSGGAGTAYEEAGRAAAAVSAALRSKGVRDSDIHTSGLNLRAELLWQEGQGQRVSGYVASTMLTAGLRHVGTASAAIAAAVDAGGDAVRVNGLELGFEDPSVVTAAAQESA